MTIRIGTNFTSEQASNKDQPGGYAGLDSGAKLKVAELPATVVITNGANLLVADADTHTPITIKAHSGSQSANLWQIQDSNGNNLVRISPSGRLTITSGDSTSARIGPGTKYGSPPAAPTAILQAGPGLTGAYQYVYTEHDTSGESTASPILTVNPVNQVVELTIPTPRRGITSRSLYRTQAGGSVFYKLWDAADGYYQTIYDDSAADSALNLASSPPAVDGTGLYNLEVNNSVQYVRLGDGLPVPDDVTFLTAADAGGGLALDVYGQIRARSRLANGLESRKTGTVGYHFLAAYISPKVQDGVVGTNVFTVAPQGATQILPQVPGTGLLVAPIAGAGPVAAGNYGIFVTLPADSQQAAIAVNQAGTSAGAYGLSVTMTAGATGHGIFINQGGSGDIIRNSAGTFRVDSGAVIHAPQFAITNTSWSTANYIQINTGLLVPYFATSPPAGFTATNGSVAVDNAGNLWFYSGGARYKLVGTAA